MAVSSIEWTPEIILRLRTLWAEGISTAAIGIRLGVSKNAVIGKAHRLNLPARPSPIKPGSHRPRPTRPPRVPVRLTTFVPAPPSAGQSGAASGSGCSAPAEQPSRGFARVSASRAHQLLLADWRARPPRLRLLRRSDRSQPTLLRLARRHRLRRQDEPAAQPGGGRRCARLTSRATTASWWRSPAARTASPVCYICFQTPDGTMQRAGGSGQPGTRLRFPQVSADLSQRWCSAYLKIDCMAALIRAQDRFLGRRTLILTGERAEESRARAHYATFEPDRTDTRNGTRRQRHVDHWRPVHGMTERDVWALLQRYGIVPAPAYRLGWSRLSCIACIFGGADQWATLRHIAPAWFEQIAAYEDSFDRTIHRTMTVRARADRGRPMPPRLNSLAWRGPPCSRPGPSRSGYRRTPGTSPPAPSARASARADARRAAHPLHHHQGRAL